MSRKIPKELRFEATYRTKPNVWIDIPDPDTRTVYQFNATFLMSSWGCIYGKPKGQGCPGAFIRMGDTEYDNTVGCCGDGAHFHGYKDFWETAERVASLTAEDVGERALAEIQMGWSEVTNDDPDNFEAKTRVWEGACIFSRRAEDGLRPGCAFLYQAMREQNIEMLHKVDHTEVMPRVCWQLPLGIVLGENETGWDVVKITAWDSAQWAEGHEHNPKRDDIHVWWCVDDSAAYHHETTPLWTRMFDAIVKMTNQDVANKLRDILVNMMGAFSNAPALWPAVAKDRPLLPLVVADKKCRHPKAFE